MNHNVQKLIIAVAGLGLTIWRHKRDMRRLDAQEQESIRKHEAEMTRLDRIGAALKEYNAIDESRHDLRTGKLEEITRMLKG